MNSTYRGTLRGDRIEWEDDVPEKLRGQAALKIVVTIPDQPLATEEPSGRRMAEALERLALHGGPASITDPAWWQREQREDRDFPGRT
jgi:hypothetical protein